MIYVVKSDRTHELFSEKKVIESIKRAGIDPSIQSQVLKHVKNKLYDGISTAQIYHHIIEFLGESEFPYSRSKFSLKQAIMSLGPTGFPFEDFISEILQSNGYFTKVRQILNGACVTHEIDVIAEKQGRSAMIEVKYHNNPGIRSQIHVALYTQARFEDIQIRNHLDEAWIVTNTKTTTEVNTYALCKNIKVMSWSYPDGESLRDMIEAKKLYPITILTTLTMPQKRLLLDHHVVLCREIARDPSVIDLLYLHENEKANVLSEIAYIHKDH